MIVPYPVTNQLYAQKIREMMLNDYHLYELSDLRGTKVFADAMVTSTIFYVEKTKKESDIAISTMINASLQKFNIKTKESLVQDEKSFIWNLDNDNKKADRHSNMNALGDFCYISKGMVLNADEKKAKGEFVKDDLISNTKDIIHCKDYIEGKDLDRYTIKRVRYLEYNTERSPKQLSRPTFEELYTNPKLLINAMGDLKASVDLDSRYYCEQQVRVALLWKDLKDVENNSISGSIKKFSKYTREIMQDLSNQVELLYLLSILNSKYGAYLLSTIRGGDFHIVPEHIRNIPIPLINIEDQQPFIALADKMLSLNSDLQQKRSRFLRRLQDNFEGVKITGALEQFDTMEFAEFLKELKKQKITLSLSQQDEWEEYFNQYKTECNNLSAEIAATDNAIDFNVYKLYGLTYDEVLVVDKDTKITREEYEK